MKIARILLGGKERLALISDDEQSAFLSSAKSIFEAKTSNSKKEIPLSRITKFLPPSSPTKIVCVGLNYRDHAEEMRRKNLLEKLPEEPVLFLKAPSALIGHLDTIVLPPSSSRVDYEAELAVVIGKKCKNASASAAPDYILGYTCFNDVTARDLQNKDGQWTRAKSFDTFAPCGPWLETECDPSDLRISCILNGKRVQDSRTSQLIFSVPELISFISSVMTLFPGDIISTGTPAGIGPMKSGDRVEVSVECIATMLNHVK